MRWTILLLCLVLAGCGNDPPARIGDYYGTWKYVAPGRWEKPQPAGVWVCRDEFKPTGPAEFVSAESEKPR